MLPPAQQQDVEAGANRPPDLHRISRMERYAGPCIMAGFILGATAAGQGMIASILKDPILIVIQVGKAERGGFVAHRVAIPWDAVGTGPGVCRQTPGPCRHTGPEVSTHQATTEGVCVRRRKETAHVLRRRRRSRSASPSSAQEEEEEEQQQQPGPDTLFRSACPVCLTSF